MENFGLIAVFEKILNDYIHFKDKQNFRYYLKNNYPDEFLIIMNENVWFSKLQLPAKLYILINRLSDFPTCACGSKIFKFNNKQLTFNKVCNNKDCKFRKEARVKIQKETCLKYYGVENQFQRPEIINDIKLKMQSKSLQEKIEITTKRKKTNLEKYGTSSPAENTAIKNKIKETNIKRYGLSTVLQNKELMDKSLISKFGVSNVMHCQEIKNKVKKTITAKYDGMGFSSKAINDKITAAMISNYGVENAMKSELIKNKLKNTIFTRFGVPSVLCLEKNRIANRLQSRFKMQSKINSFSTVIPLFDFENDYTNVEKTYKWLCQCGSTFDSTLDDGRYPKCPVCFPYIKSKEELNIISFIENELGLKTLHNKKPFGNFEIDILIPEAKIAIEYNGLYWHSDDKLDKLYHLNKTNAVELNGYKLIHIYEHQWLFNKTIVKSHIKSILHKNIYFDINNYKVIVISNDIISDFLASNYIFDTDVHNISLGLFNDTELIATMSFNISENNNYHYILNAFVMKLNIENIHAFDILFSYFKNHYKPTSISAYVNRDYNLYIEYYLAAGFEFKYTTDPNSWVYKRNEKPTNKYSNVNISDDNNWDYLKNQGYNRYWDTGYVIYQWHKIKN